MVVFPAASSPTMRIPEGEEGGRERGGREGRGRRVQRVCEKGRKDELEQGKRESGDGWVGGKVSWSIR